MQWRPEYSVNGWYFCVRLWIWGILTEL